MGKWAFEDLLRELRNWLKRNEIDEEFMVRGRDEKRGDFSRPRGSFMTTEKRGPRCFYCPSKHWPDKCNVITDKKERKQILIKKGLCFKCGESHLVRDCTKRGCFICQGNHHASLHEERIQRAEASLSVYTQGDDCILPLIPVELKGEQIWGILDTGATKNYISRKAVELLKLRPLRWETTSLRTAEGQGKSAKRAVYEVKTCTSKGENFEFEAVGLDQTNFAKVERTQSKDLKMKYSYLRGLHIPESRNGTYEIHILFGDPTFTDMRTGNCRKGLQGQPIADETVFGWAVHGERAGADQSFFTQTTNEEYERLYRLDVLGIEDRKEFDQQEVRKEFMESIEQNEEGRYTIKVPWIDERKPQNSNEAQSRVRLRNLMSKMKDNVREKYEAIIREQLEMGIIEEAPEVPTGKRVYYMPHKPVIREEAISTKVRMVFDASAKPSLEDYSINECMNPGPPTQPLLWDILIRSRMAPVCIIGDVEKAFLQVELDVSDRDAFRFLFKSKEGIEKHYRFCRVPFGGESSPFILGGVIQYHLETVQGDDGVKEALKENTYVDNVMGLVANEEDAEKFKVEATNIMSKGKFPLGKWESNLEHLNDDKERVKTKLLGIGWNKNEDIYAVELELKEHFAVTKRTMLKTLSSIYDPLGLMSPVIVEGKHLYRLAVDEKKGWDSEVSKELKEKWIKWLSSLKKVEVPRSIAPYLENITLIVLHHFMDASSKAVSAQTIAIVRQPSGTSQGLLSSKSRISKRGLTIARLELVACHMGANIAENTNRALKRWPIRENYCWTDSLIALCWIRRPYKNWKSFVSNRVKRIKEITDELDIKWKYVPTKLNHADFGSRGVTLKQLQKQDWWKGPDWLTDESKWPEEEITLDEENLEIRKEQKANEEQVLVTTEEKESLDAMLRKGTLKKGKRVMAWMFRFCHNAKSQRNKDQIISGPLTTEEVEKADKCLIRKAQENIDLHSKESQQLGLMKFNDGLVRCVGRIQDEQPIFIPRKSEYAIKLCQEAHKDVGHKGVNISMARVREKYWIPRLRTILKKVKRDCENCKIMNAKPYPIPDVGMLPEKRITANYPFGVTGIDFVGPFQVKEGGDHAKAYVIVFSCATSRAVSFTVAKSMEAKEFIDKLNDFISVHSRPREIISDNAKTFKVAAKFIDNLRKSEVLHEYLADQDIKWEFILAKSPWRGAFYERLNKDLKSILFQKLGRSHLPMDGLKRVIKDIEIIFNNRPLQYVEDEIGSRVLTPNSIIHGREVYTLEEIEEDDTPSKMEKRIRKAKEEMWRKWRTEYVRALRERHDVTKRKQYHPELGEVVLVVGASKNKHEWHHGLVCEHLKGKDGVCRGVRMIVKNKIWERPLQLTCPLEIKSTMTPQELNQRIRVANKETENAEAEDEARPERQAVRAAKNKIQCIAETEEEYI